MHDVAAADPAGRRPRWPRGSAPDLVVIGPEAPLVAGVAGRGPGGRAALLRPGSGRGHDRGIQVVRQAGHGRGRDPDRRRAHLPDAGEASAALDAFGPPYVVKADGLAAGKGVVVTADRAEARGTPPLAAWS